MVVAAVVVGVFLCGYCAWEGEKTFHSFVLATAVVERFIQQENRWPTSWDDLQVVDTVEAGSMYSWPNDAKIVQDYVTIDFDADLTTIGSQRVEEFDSIGPIQAGYEDYQGPRA